MFVGPFVLCPLLVYLVSSLCAFPSIFLWNHEHDHVGTHIVSSSILIFLKKVFWLLKLIIPELLLIQWLTYEEPPPQLLPVMLLVMYKTTSPLSSSTVHPVAFSLHTRPEAFPHHSLSQVSFLCADSTLLVTVFTFILHYSDYLLSCVSMLVSWILWIQELLLMDIQLS